MRIKAIKHTDKYGVEYMSVNTGRLTEIGFGVYVNPKGELFLHCSEIEFAANKKDTSQLPHTIAAVNTIELEAETDWSDKANVSH